MFSAPTLLAIFFALILSVVLALCLPVWLSVGITVAALLSVAIGGGALLAKASVLGALVMLGFWLRRRRVAARIPADVKLAAIPEANTTQPQAERSRTERRAA